MAKDAVFNPRRHRLLRKQIPITENLITVGLSIALLGIVLWVAAQKNNFDPADRDVSPDLLRQASNALTLYNPPLKPWRVPGTESASPQIFDFGPFPAAIADSVWQPTAPFKQFGPDNLFEKINGEAPKFLKQGFRKLFYVVLRSKADNSEIAIELFDQTDMGGSLGVFSEHQTAETAPEQQGDVVYFRTSIGMIGRKGQFFFRVAGDSDSEAIREKAQQLAVAFEQLPDAEVSEQPLEFRVLNERLGIASEQIAFQKQNVFQYDFARAFWFGRPDPDNSAALFIHQAESPELAQQLFDLLLEEQGYDYEIVEQGEQQALLWHRFLDNHFALGQLGPFVFGTENEKDRDRSQAVLKQFAEALADE
ncbi:MAG: hypothetical protein HC808_03510 [Candidatus Competibacteraceae bacterium]|nr:hypothetical protein [Candidatus Competibacteraceae bacterium]